jgi:hypothetical protein
MTPLIEIRLTPAGNLRWETLGDAPEDARFGRDAHKTSTDN